MPTKGNFLQDDLKILTRRPANTGRICAFPFFVQETYKKLTFFFSKKTLSSSFFLTFSTFKIFWFFANKSLQLGRNRHFYEMIPFDTHSTANLSPLSLLKKKQVFFRKTHFFSKKPPKFERFEKSHYFSRILQQICYNLVKKNSRSVMWLYCRCWRVGVNVGGKHRVKKKRQKWPIWEEYFAFIFLRTWRKITIFMFWKISFEIMISSKLSLLVRGSGKQFIIRVSGVRWTRTKLIAFLFRVKGSCFWWCSVKNWETHLKFDGVLRSNMFRSFVFFAGYRYVEYDNFLFSRVVFLRLSEDTNFETIYGRWVKQQRWLLSFVSKLWIFSCLVENFSTIFLVEISFLNVESSIITSSCWPNII